MIKSTMALLVLTSSLIACVQAQAQQVRGTPGSPSAVMTPQGLQLPPPTPPFSGAIAPNAVDSTSAWPPQVMPPPNAPNVLLILTDDVGFGAPSSASLRRGGAPSIRACSAD